ncbi:MAG: RecX family transcriptional regulator [Clostridia bacterium]|nr:RecX family transcriptional regulator [Clostridia bacterium]
MTPSAERLYKKALGRLSISDMTPRGLYEWLIEKEPDADHGDAKEAVRQLFRDGFVNEERYFGELLSEGERKLWGELKFKEELKKRRFGDKYAKRFASLEIDFCERAKALAKTLCPNGVSSDAEKRKLISRLAAKGHSFENARSAALSVTSGDAGEE